MRFVLTLIMSFTFLNLSANTSEYICYDETEKFDDLKEDPDLKVLVSDKSIVIDCNGHYFNVLKVQHPQSCPACEAFKKEYPH